VQAIEPLGELGEGVVSNYMYMSAAEVLPSLLPKSSMESVLHIIHWKNHSFLIHSLRCIAWKVSLLAHGDESPFFVKLVLLGLQIFKMEICSYIHTPRM
jgi:hypothetical protein